MFSQFFFSRRYDLFRRCDGRPATHGKGFTVAVPQISQAPARSNVTSEEKQIWWTIIVIDWLSWLALGFAMKNKKMDKEYE